MAQAAAARVKIDTLNDVAAVNAAFPEHTFTGKDFQLKGNADDIQIDTNFASQSFWKDVRIRFFRKKSAVFGLIMIVVITLMAILGPGMNEYTYSGQELSQKNLAPRIPVIEDLGIFDGSETIATTTGTRVTNQYEEKGLDDV